VGANARFFEGEAAAGTYLTARGFDRSGNKAGGIIAPKRVEVEPGAILFRLFHVERQTFGQWWSTAAELERVFDYFGREGAAAAEGRPAGKGILHATLVIRHDWSRPSAGSPPSPDHLGRFVCATPTVALTAYFGVGDDAPSEDKRSVQKAVKILGPGGAQLGVRQIFFPNCWEYQDRFAVLDSGWTDSNLLPSLRKHRQGRLDFE
jgi:hypothetical protein